MQEKFLQIDVPAIVARLSSLHGFRSDAEVSRWLERADNYISIAKKRKAIDVALILERVAPENWAYVLLKSEAPGSIPTQPPPTMPPDAIPQIRPLAITAIRRPLEDISKDVEASPEELRNWVDGASQPSHRQLVLLFNELYKATGFSKETEAFSNHPDAPPAVGRPKRKEAA